MKTVRSYYTQFTGQETEWFTDCLRTSGSQLLAWGTDWFVFSLEQRLYQSLPPCSSNLWFSPGRTLVTEL